MSKKESELKFTCEAYHSQFIQRGVESVCIADSNFQKNIVSSVYFDTDDWFFAMEKASSDFLKTKMRLRWYQDNEDPNLSAPTKCFLEFKRKIGSKRTKNRVEMPFSGNQVLESLQDVGYLALIQQCIAEHAPDLLGYSLEPKFVVRYSRNRYFEPFSNTRVSFDTNIRAFSVGSSYAYLSSHIVLDESVLEVKGNCDDLPIALRTFHAGNLKKAAFSKYYESFKLLTGYQQ